MLTTLATLAALALMQQTDTTVPVRAGARLEISNFGGEIAVKTWSRNAVRVMAEHSSRDRIRIDASDQVVRVKTEAGRRGPSQIDYAVTVPAWMALNLSGVYTDIKVDGAQNEITAETVQGEVTVLGGSGNVLLKSIRPRAFSSVTAPMTDLSDTLPDPPRTVTSKRRAAVST